MNLPPGATIQVIVRDRHGTLLTLISGGDVDKVLRRTEERLREITSFLGRELQTTDENSLSGT